METAAQYRQVLGGHHRVPGNGTAGNDGATNGKDNRSSRKRGGWSLGWDGQRLAMQATARTGSDRHGTTFSDGNISEGHLARNRMAGQDTACRGQAGHGTTIRSGNEAGGHRERAWRALEWRGAAARGQDWHGTTARRPQAASGHPPGRTRLGEAVNGSAWTTTRHRKVTSRLEDRSGRAPIGRACRGEARPGLVRPR